MRYRLSIPMAALLLGALGAPALADGHWCVSVSGGLSVSTGHGAALDFAAFAEPDPLMSLGIETGVADIPDRRHNSFPARS